MQNLDRESILRIFGLHDASSIARQINAIQLSLEEQDGQMTTFWTEIRKDEKQISLIAGRMDTAETNIGQLQVTATALNASVTSLQTTVNGDSQTTGLVSRVGSLEITANSLNLSVQSLQTTVNGDGQTTGLVSRVSSLEITEGSISQRVGVIEGDYVKSAQISLMVVKDGNGYISNALIDADDIDFVFTQAVSWYWQSKTETNKRMGLDSSGNLWISGEYRGGTIVNTVQVGTGTKNMYIEPISSGQTTGARLVGKDGTYESLWLGFYNNGTDTYPSLYLKAKASNNQDSLIRIMVGSDFAEVLAEAAGTTGSYHTIRLIAYPRYNYATIEGKKWPKITDTTIYNSLSTGAVYIDNGYLKVKGY